MTDRQKIITVIIYDDTKQNAKHECHGGEGGTCQKSRRRAINLALTSVGETNLLLSLTRGFSVRNSHINIDILLISCLVGNT